MEEEYYENGNPKRIVFEDSADGTYSENIYYENGDLEYSRNESPEQILEEWYDEEGYRTYFNHKNADFEIEMTADSNGKLERVIENGTEIEDPAILAQYASGYHFRQE